MAKDKKAKDNLIKFSKDFGREEIIVRERKVQTCQKCFKHRERRILKNHRDTCPYKTCGCDDCKLVDKRRFAVKSEAKRTRRLKKVNNECDSPVQADLSWVMSSEERLMDHDYYNSNLCSYESSGYGSDSSRTEIDIDEYQIEPRENFTDEEFYEVIGGLTSGLFNSSLNMWQQQSNIN